MSVPILMLLGFAAWTLLLLMATVGIYRWSLIFQGSAQIASFRADAADGAGWYQRGTRAHANCVENLPVFGVIVFALQAADVAGALVNGLAIAILAARVVQSLVHTCFVQTNTKVAVRFSFYSVQLVCFLWLIVLIVLKVAGGA